MKNWNELSAKEKAELQVEFDIEYRFKIPNFKYGLYIMSFISFFFAITFSISGSQNKGFDSYTAYVRSTLGGIFLVIFLITLTLAIINSVLIGKRKKKFEKWLLTKNIIKI